MSEHDDRYARDDLPRTTGEFRATPDVSASTAEFKAFVASQDADGRRPGESWPEQPWAGATGARGSNRPMLWLGAAAALVIVLLIVFLAVG